MTIGARPSFSPRCPMDPGRSKRMTRNQAAHLRRRSMNWTHFRRCSGGRAILFCRTVCMKKFLGAGIYKKVPSLGTKIQAGYKWVNGITVSSVDSYGESLYRMDPYLHLIFRQPLPKFALGRWEAIADCNNLLAQGYVSTSSRDGHVVLVPAFRTFRGGLSVQF